MSSERLNNVLDINLDKLINPYLPHNQARRLPKPISHFLGYRSTPAKEPPTLIQWTLTILSTVAGICTVAGVYNYAPGITKWNPPPIVASLGATAVLDYNTVRSPLGQPRNNLVGHTLAAIVGVAIAKACMLSPTFFADYPWVAAAIACALASVAMSITNTVHPPGGATAILACTEKQIIVLGWMFPPMILLASVLMVAVACIFNNTLRQYPTCWWTPEDVGYKLPHNRRKASDDTNAEEEDVEKRMSTPTPSSDLTVMQDCGAEFVEGIEEVQILPYRIRLPSHVKLNNEEIEFLRSLQDRLKEHSEIN